MALKSEDWDSFLEAVSSNRTDQTFILQTIVPLINNTNFVTNIDCLGECSLFYAITYQNKLLLSYLLKYLEYDLLTKKLRKKLRLSIFRGIKQLGYHSGINASFLAHVFQSILSSPCKNILKDFVHERLFQHLFESVFQKDRPSVDLIQCIINLLKNQLHFTEEDSNFKNLETIFQVSNISCLWSYFGVRYFIKSASLDFSLTYLKYEFFHHAAEKGLYNQMEAFEFTKNSEFLFQKNSSGENVFVILFKKAPFEFLNKHLDNFAEAVNTVEDPLILTNNRKQNFLHLLILNKKASLQEKTYLLQKLNELCNLEVFNKMADHNNMTPVVLFIQRFSNEIKENLSPIIHLIQMLMPKIQENEIEHLTELKKSQSFIFTKYLIPHLSSFDLEGPHHIYNQKLLKICLDLKLESLLIALLEKNNYLNLDSFYMENLALARHFLCIAAENNCQDILKWTLQTRINSHSRMQLLTEEFWLLGEIEPQNSTKQNPNYSIFDLMLDFINNSIFETVEDQIKKLFFDILENLWSRNTEQESIQAMLNTSYSRRTFHQTCPHYFVIKVITASKQERISNFFRNDVLKLQDHLDQSLIKGILIDMLRSDASTFFRCPEFSFLVQNSKPLTETELLIARESLMRYPYLVRNITDMCPQLTEGINIYRTFASSQIIIQKSKEAMINIGKIIIESFLLDPSKPQPWIDFFERKTYWYLEFKETFLLEIIRYIIEEKKIIKVLQKLEEVHPKFDCTKYLDICCREYIKSCKKDDNIEEQLFTLCTKKWENDQNYFLNGNQFEEKTRKIKTVLSGLDSLEQLEKMGRMKLKGWIFSFNIDSLMGKLKKTQEKSPVQVYLRLFITSKKSWINDYAIELCKASLQHSTFLKEIYSNIFQRNHQELELLDHAILNSDLEGVEAILNNKIYSDNQFLAAKSPFYKILELLNPLKISNNLKTLNQIISKLFRSFPKEVLITWIIPISPGFQIPRVRKLCLVREEHLHKFLTEENFQLIPFKSIIIEATKYFSFRGQIYSSVSFCIQAIYQRSVETIQILLPFFLQIQPGDQLWYLKTTIDFYLLYFSELLLNEDKFRIILTLLKIFKSSNKINFLLKSSFKFCMQSKDKTHLESLIKCFVSEKIEFKDSYLLNELRKIDQLNYSHLQISNACVSQIYTTPNDFIEINFEHFQFLFDSISHTSQFEDLKFLFLTFDHGEALAVNGLHKKLQLLLNLGQKLVHENRFKQQDFIEWIQKVLESSCQIVIFVNAEKSAENPKNSQFNYFQLGTRLMINTKKIEPSTRFLPTYSKFVRIESGLSKYSYRDASCSLKGPSRQGDYKTSKSIIYGQSDKGVLSSRSLKPEQSEKRDFLLAFQPFFQPYPTNWSLKDQPDESNLEKTIILLLQTLMRLSHSENVTQILQKNLILATQARAALVQNIIEKYLDQLQTQNFGSFIEFYLQLLLRFFQTINCFKFNKAIRKKSGREDLNAIKSLFKRLHLIHYISERTKPIVKPLLENLICQIYQSGDAQLGKIFYENFCRLRQEDGLISREILKGIFLNSCIQQKNLSCFMNLLNLDPSTTYIYQIIDAKSATLSRQITTQKIGENFVLLKRTILDTLFSKNLFEFVAEYDKLQSLSLLQPVDHINLKSKTCILLKNISNPKWIHLALFKGCFSLVERYLFKAEFSETEMECAFYSQNFDLVKIILTKGSLGDDPQRILEFLTRRKILFQILQDSSEDFILQVFSSFVLEVPLKSDQIKHLFNLNHLKETDECGWTIFHYIAYRKLPNVFYALLSFIKRTLCENDKKNFTQAMTDLLNFTASHSSSVTTAINSPFLFDTDFKPLRLCPIQVSVYSKFYELICFVAEFNIPVNNSSLQLWHTNKNFEFLSAAGTVINEFSSLFVESKKALTRILKLLQNLKYYPLSRWTHLVVDTLFIHPLRWCNPAFLKQPIFRQENGIQKIFLDSVFIKLDLSLRNISSWKLSPLALIYLLEKASDSLGLEKTEYSKYLYQHYLQEIELSTYRESKEEKFLAKIWLDTELNSSLDKIIRILDLTHKEQIFLQNPKEFIGLTKDDILKIADLYNSNNYKAALKVLILAFPTLFIQKPEAYNEQENAERLNCFNFWKHLIFDANYMCSVISTIDDRTFNYRIASQFETLLSLYEEAHTIPYSQPEIQSWAMCILYILFSLRGEGTSPLLEYNSFPNVFKRVLNLLFHNNPAYGKGPTTMFPLFFQNLSNFATDHQLTFRKRLVPNEDILKKIGSDLINSFLPQDQQKENDPIGVTLQDQDINQFIGSALTVIIESGQQKQDLLIFYPRFIYTITQYFKLIQDIRDFAEKFQIKIQLSLTHSEIPSDVQIKKLAPKIMQIDLCYQIIENHIDKSFSIQWTDKRKLDIEKIINHLFIIDDIQKNLEANFVPFKKDSCFPTIEIDYNSLAKASFEEKFHLLNNHLSLNFIHQTYFGILPYLEKVKQWILSEQKSNLPIINEIGENHIPLEIKINQEEIFTLYEFYQLVYPKITHIKVSYLTKQAFKEFNQDSCTFDRLLRSLSLYEKVALKLSKVTSEQINKIAFDSVDWFVGDEPLKFAFDLFYHDAYQMKQIMNILNQLSYETYKSQRSYFDKSSLLPFGWKVNTRSLLIAVSSLTEVIRNAVSESLSSRKFISSRERKKMIESYLDRRDDALKTTENYIRSSLLTKVIYDILKNLSDEKISISQYFNAIYIILQNIPEPKNSYNIMDWKNLHLFDQIIRFSDVVLQPTEKTLLVKINYYVSKISCQDLEEGPMSQSRKAQDYIHSIFSKFEIYRQLMTIDQFVDHLLEKKLIEESLTNLSNCISAKIHKKIAFSFDFSKVYELCESVINKPVSSAIHKSESNELYATLEEKLIKIKDYILKDLPLEVEEFVLSDDYMDELVRKVQLQNLLNSDKKIEAEYLEEGRLGFSLYPPNNPNRVIIYDIPRNIIQTKFAFLIQTHKELTILNALIGQQYLIVTHSKMWLHQVSANQPLPSHSDAHFLLISNSWPNLDFCSNTFSQVFVIDGCNRIIDISNSRLNKLIEDFKNENILTKSDLLNKAFDLAITVHDLLPIYPSSFIFQLSSFDPESTELQNSPPQSLNDQKTVKLNFLNDQKVQMSSLFFRNVKFSEKLKTSSIFQATTDAFQMEFDQLLDRLDIKELLRRNQKTPDILLRFDENFRYNRTIQEFNRYLTILMTEIRIALFKLLDPSLIQKFDKIQQTACLLDDKIYLENNIVSYRILSSLCRTIQSFEIIFKNDHIQPSILFNSETRAVQIFIHCSDENEGSKDVSSHFNIPVQTSIFSFITNLLINQEIILVQNSLDKNPSQQTDFEVMLSKIKFSVTLNLDVNNIEDQTQLETLITLIFLDFILWNTATALNLIKASVMIGEKLILKITNTDKHPVGVAEKNTLTLKIPSRDFMNLIPTYQEISQTLSPHITDSFFHFKVKSLSNLTLIDNQTELSFAFSLKDLSIDDLNQTQIGANFLGIQFIDMYYLNSFEINKTQENLVVKFLIPSSFPSQNYLVYLRFNKRLIFEPFHINNLSASKSKANSNFALNALRIYTSTVLGEKKHIQALINSPFYLVAKSKKRIFQEKNISSFKPYLFRMKGGQTRSISGFDSNFIKTNSKVLDDSHIVYKIILFQSLKLEFEIDTNLYTFLGPQDENSSISVSFLSGSPISIADTRVQAANGKFGKTTEKRNKLIKIFKASSGKNYQQLFINLVSTKRLLDSYNFKDHKTFFIGKDLEKPEIQKFMETNFINKAFGRDHYYSKAGEERKETLQFRDNNQQKVLIHPEEVLAYSAVFIHKRNHDIVFPGKISYSQQNISVTWAPLIKGSYSLLINGKFVQNAYNLLVIASESSVIKSTFKWPQIELCMFYKTFPIEVELRDHFGNKLNQIEYDTYYEENKTVQHQVSQQATAKANIIYGKVSNFGTQTNQISISPDYTEGVSATSEITLTFLLNQKQIHSLIIKVSAFCFRKRHDLFCNELAKYRIQWGDYRFPGLFSLEVPANFMPYEPIKPKYFTCGKDPKFDNGGFRRGFWESIGSEIKGRTNKIFTLSDNRYSLLYGLIIDESTERNLRCYGKLIASSILYRGLVGVHFGLSFAKALFNEPFDPDGEKELSMKHLCNGKKEIFLNTSDQELAWLNQCFVVNIRGKKYELIPNGKNIRVTRINLKLFLQEVKRMQLKLTKNYQRALDLIKEGFNRVFPIQFLKKWFESSEFALLTFGKLNVSGTDLLKIIKFDGNEPTLQQFFTQFLVQADSKLLRNFLKFITGSRALPFDDPSYYLHVTFSDQEIKYYQLYPKSQNCSKRIHIPRYKSYEQMKEIFDDTFSRSYSNWSECYH